MARNKEKKELGDGVKPVKKQRKKKPKTRQLANSDSLDDYCSGLLQNNELEQVVFYCLKDGEKFMVFGAGKLGLGHFLHFKKVDFQVTHFSIKYSLHSTHSLFDKVLTSLNSFIPSSKLSMFREKQRRKYGRRGSTIGSKR